jgi:hypothetical protein
MSVVVELENNWDPQNVWGDREDKQERLEAACGVLPFFFMDAVMQRAETAEDTYASMVKSYSFGDYRFKGGSVTTDGTYVSEYTEDPDMVPYVTFVAKWEGGETVKLHIYRSAILSVVDSKSTIISRMD